MCLPLGAGPRWFRCSSSWWLLLSRKSSRIWYEKHFHPFGLFYIVQSPPPSPLWSTAEHFSQNIAHYHKEKSKSGSCSKSVWHPRVLSVLIHLTKYSFIRAVKYSRTNISVITLLILYFNKSFELFYFCIFTWRQCRPDETICLGFCFSLFVLWGLSCSLQSTEEALMLMWEQQATLRHIDTSSSTP